MNEKQLLHEMKKKKNLDSYLPEYCERFASLYYTYSAIQLAFSYYTLFEVLAEEKTLWAEDVVSSLNACLILEGEDAIAKLRDLRFKVMQLMEDVTACTDTLGIYEHIFNRVEYRFREVTVPDLSVTATRIQQFIFADKDTVTINEKIKAIIAELPLRMTKQRFFDILADSLSIYKDSDEAGVEGFLYQLRTTAGLREEFPEIAGASGIKELIRDCRDTDYSAITQETYEQLTSRLNEISDQLLLIVNVYMQVQECINHYYTMQLCKPYITEHNHTDETAVAMMEQIRDHFEEESSVVLDGCDSYLSALEGKQEDIMERVMGFEALFPDVQASFAEDARVQALNICSLLVSSSIFVDIDRTEQSKPATPEMIAKATDTLIEEFAEFFKQHSKMVNKAVMSAILGTVPVFFNNSEEIVEYISYSLEHCNDEKELCASIDLINEYME